MPPTPTTARLLVAAGLTLLLAACSGASGADGPAPEAITVDDCDRQVTLDRAPERVLTVGTSAPLLLHAAGAADRVVARAGEFGSPLPAEVEAVLGDAEVVDPADPALEVIVDADPDLVYGYGLYGAEPADVEAAGITTLTVTGECGHAARAESLQDLTSFEVIAQDVRTLGRIFGTSEVADAAAVDLLDRVEAVRGAHQDAEPATAAGVYFFAGALSVTGGTSVMHDQLATLGLTDVHADLREGFAEVSVEALLDADPDIIVLTHGFDGDTFDDAHALLLAQPGAERLRAVAGGRVIGLPAALRQPDPGAVDGLEELAAQLADG